MIPGRMSKQNGIESEVSIECRNALLDGTMVVPEQCAGIVLFAHGSGSSRRSPRNRYVAQVLQSRGIATLLFDLLTREEESVDEFTGELRFNIRFLAERLIGATHWVMQRPDLQSLGIGYFGASTGAGAALVAAAKLPEVVGAVVSRGGRPDLAGDALRAVEAPTLLIVGGNDQPVIGMNQTALAKLKCPEKQLIIIPGATHLFEEPGTLEEVARVAAGWFTQYLATATRAHAPADTNAEFA
ncbi:MAG: dienelactone hydrolase family protein [Candidatus Acidiferrales bacterium]